MSVIISLFDESGNALRPWASSGHTCYAIDLLNKRKPVEKVGKGSITYLDYDLTQSVNVGRLVRLKPKFVMGFPPCTDLAVSGAAHFAKKRAEDPDFQTKATELAKRVEYVANKCNAPFFAENPKSVLATLWRKGDYRFDPCDYGGYLPEDDIHPRWPDYIPARDAYTKETWLWTGNGFIMPDKKPVEPIGNPQYAKLGGKSKKTKQIRSETPRGFAQAIFDFNG